MFEISDLKAKKLPELQEIAKDLNVPKFKTLKKLDLVYQILDVQASNPKAVSEAAPSQEKPAPKPKRARTPRTQSADHKKPKTETAEKAPEIESKDKKEDAKGQPPKKESKQNTPPKPQKNTKRSNQHQQQHQKNNHHDKKNNNFDKDLKNRYKEPEFEFASLI